MTMPPFEKNPKNQKIKIIPSEQLGNILSWRYEFFTRGHTMNEIDEMSYWDLIEISKYQNYNERKRSGQTTYKELKPSQRTMIEKRKEILKREGKM